MRGVGRNVSTGRLAAARPVAAATLRRFPRALREAGLPVDPERAATFLTAVGRCRLATPRDLARIGRVTLTGSHEDFPIFDAVFEACFGEATFEGRVDAPEQDRAPRPAPSRGQNRPLTDVLEGEAAGSAAAADHLHGRKSFGRATGADRAALLTMARHLDHLPRRLGRTWAPAPAGGRIDLARTARAARRTFGETLNLMRAARPEKPRRLLLLIDVSGSMKAQSEIYLRYAHLLTHARPKVETFCFGTRLTRATAALRHRNADEALKKLSGVVFDFDGGTAIGASLEAFLAVSRHAALVRGAVTIVLSDGLERGEPDAMQHCVSRLARLSHRLVWATPLAADPRYRPATRAMRAILPDLDALYDAGGLAALDRMTRDLNAACRRPRGRAAATRG